MEFIQAAVDLDDTANDELRESGLTGCLQFAVDSQTGYLKDCWARAQGAVQDLTTDLDRYHRLSDLAFEEEERLGTVKAGSSEYNNLDYFIWGIRSMLADLEPKGHLVRRWREDFEPYVARFHTEFGDCSKLGYCPCKK